jgi:hypothetical protein
MTLDFIHFRFGTLVLGRLALPDIYTRFSCPRQPFDVCCTLLLFATKKGLALQGDTSIDTAETYNCIVHVTVLVAFWLDNFSGFLYGTKQNRHVPFF